MTDHRQNYDSHVGISAMILAALFWSTNILFGKLLLDFLPPFTLSLLRQLVTAIVAVPLYYFIYCAQRNRTLKEWLVLSGIGLLGFAIPHTLIYLALQHTSAISISILNSLVPVIVVTIGVLVFGFRASIALPVGIFISAIGAMIVLTSGNLEGVTILSFGNGEVIGLIAMVSSAIYTTLSGAFLRNVPGLAIAAAGGVVGAVLLIPFAVFEIWSGAPIRINGEVLLGVFYVGIFPSTVAMILWSMAIRRLGPEWASQGVHLVPLFTSLLAISVLGERVQPYHGLAILLSIAGVYLAQRSRLVKR